MLVAHLVTFVVDLIAVAVLAHLPDSQRYVVVTLITVVAPPHLLVDLLVDVGCRTLLRSLPDCRFTGWFITGPTLLLPINSRTTAG